MEERIKKLCYEAKLKDLADLLCEESSLDITRIRGDSGRNLLHILAEGNRPATEKIVQDREKLLEVYAPMVSLLMFHGLDINSTDNFGMTCLHIAAQHGSSAFITILLKRGANPTAIAKHGKNVLHFATENPDVDAWNVLTSSLRHPLSFLEATTSSGMTPALMASLFGNPVAVANICKDFAHPLTTRLAVQTPKKLSKKMIKILESNRLTANDLDRLVILTGRLKRQANRRLLHILFQNESPATISEYMNEKNMLSKKPSNWLLNASKSSSEETILALLEYGALPAPDFQHLTPFHYCLYRGFYKACIVIIQRLSLEDIFVDDHSGRSIMHWLATLATSPSTPSLHIEPSGHQKNSCEPLVRDFWYFLSIYRAFKSKKLCYRNNGKEPSDSPIPSHMQSIVDENTSLLQVLVQDKCLWKPDEQGNTPLHILAQRDSSGYATSLVCKWVDVDILLARNAKGRTALHMAAMSKSSKSLENLMAAYENHAKGDKTFLDMTDYKGRTALMYALSASYLPIVQALLDAGASSKIRDLKGRTVVSIAAKNNNLMALAQLVDNKVCSLYRAKVALQRKGFRSSISEFSYLVSSLTIGKSAADDSSPSLIPSVKSLQKSAPSLCPSYHLVFPQPSSPSIIRTPSPESNRGRVGDSGHTSQFPEPEQLLPKKPSLSVSIPFYDHTTQFMPGLSSPRQSRNGFPAEPLPPVSSVSLSHGYASHDSDDRSEFAPSSPGLSSIGELYSASTFSEGSEGLDSPKSFGGYSGLGSNLEEALNKQSLNRSLSTSPPRGGSIHGWSYSPPASPMMSPHLSPRNLSPRNRGTSTPSNSSSSPGYERMRLQRSLSPRSLPTISEINPIENSAEQKPPPTKRNRSGSNSSLAKKALMMRSRSLTKLPVSPGQDFLECVKASSPSAHSVLSPRVGPPPGQVTYSPTTSMTADLSGHYSTHTRSNSDHPTRGPKLSSPSKFQTPQIACSSSSKSSTGPIATLTTTSTKKRPKSVGKSKTATAET